MINAGVFSDFDIKSLYPPLYMDEQVEEQISKVDKFIRECHKNMNNKGAKNRRRAILNAALKRFYKTYNMDSTTKSIMIIFILDKKYYDEACEFMNKLKNDKRGEE